jgi:1,2-diacylglycerol 3-alpha-glucosyltransferase
MKVLFVTNVFTPHVGGVARSVESFTKELRSQGAEVFVVAPEFENMPEEEECVMRVSALQHFNGSDFSVVYPFTGSLRQVVKAFEPDVIHSHHPFLLGATALRMARLEDKPLVFTHHTMYEDYTHYVPGDSKTLKRFTIELATGYANMCQAVVAPSESTRDILVNRGVTTPVNVVPTGVQLDRFVRGSGSGFRDIMGIPHEARVIGHVGRLAPEKNLYFLTSAIVDLMKRDENVWFLLVGSGPMQSEMETLCDEGGVSDRLCYPGTLQGDFLTSAYKAMDVFAFASTTETQGMVLTEAMAAGTPVVALDAAGAREVVRDGVNGCLLIEQTLQTFADALEHVAEDSTRLRDGCLQTAQDFGIRNSTRKLLGLYQSLIDSGHDYDVSQDDAWHRTQRFIAAEWEIFKGVADAAEAAVQQKGSSPLQRV